MASSSSMPLPPVVKGEEGNWLDIVDTRFRAIYLSRKMERTRDSVKTERYLYNVGDTLPDEIDWNMWNIFGPRCVGRFLSRKKSKNMDICDNEDELKVALLIR